MEALLVIITMMTNDYKFQTVTMLGDFPSHDACVTIASDVARDQVADLSTPWTSFIVNCVFPDEIIPLNGAATKGDPT